MSEDENDQGPNRDDQVGDGRPTSEKQPKRDESDDQNPDRDDQVGYGRPPIATRFKAGGVGNPKGRPKKTKTVGQIIQAALMTRVTVEENGRPKSVTAQEVIIRNLVHAAARRDTRAIHTLFALRDRYQDSPETTLDPSQLDADDRKIIDEYFARFPNNTKTPSSYPACEAKDDSEQIITGANPKPDEPKE
jgi:hypothetical protein